MLVHRVLEPIWSTKPHVGQRLRERIEAVLDYAKGMKLRSGENPALWRGNLEHMLPKANRTSRKHHPALPYAELPAFMAELRALPGVAARALEFTILTAARTGEARFARWSRVRPFGRRLDRPRRANEGRQGAPGAAIGWALALLRRAPA